MALSLAVSSVGFQGAAPLGRAAPVQMSAINVGDIGTTRPLGVWDPLGLMTKMPEKYRRWQEMEIKHGRIAMAAFAHVIVTGAGYKFDGYASYLSFPPLKFEDIPAGTLGSWAALPQAGWAQIVAVVAILDNSLFAQDPARRCRRRQDPVGALLGPRGQGVQAQRRAQQRPRRDDGHHWHDDPRGAHRQPDLADRLRARQVPAHPARGGLAGHLLDGQPVPDRVNTPLSYAGTERERTVHRRFTPNETAPPRPMRHAALALRGRRVVWALG